MIMSTLADNDRGTESSALQAKDRAERAKYHLQSQPYRVLRQITCDYLGGRVILRGSVPSFYYKQLAQALVLSLPDIGPMANLIEVQAARTGDPAQA
jgi:hypothetical protein